MRRWMWTMLLTGTAIGAALVAPPTARQLAPEAAEPAEPEPPAPPSLRDSIDESFWIDAVDCGMG